MLARSGAAEAESTSGPALEATERDGKNVPPFAITGAFVTHGIGA